MRVRYAILISSFVLSISPQNAFAQSAQGADTTYQTLLALIDEMVANKLITREKADALVANAKAKAAVASAAPAPQIAPIRERPAVVQAVPVIAVSSPDPGAKVAPVEVGNMQIAKGAGGVDLPPDINVDWSRGAPVFASKDGQFTFKPRGRILADVSSTSGSDYDRRNITVSTLRQFRMGGVGTIGEHIFYQFEADFRRNSVEVVNTFLGYRAKLGKVNTDIRAGNLITDRGIDIGTAATANPFITTNINTIALATQGGRAYLMGIAARAGQKNWHWSVAVHGDALDSDFTRNDHRMFLTRAHWNPILTDKAIVHVGGWAYSEHIPAATASVAVNQFISGALNNSVQVNAATLTGATGSKAFGLEFGGTYGPVYAFSEYGERHVKGGPAAAFDMAKFKTLSVNGGFWLTGEKPTYASVSGTYVAPNVLEPVTEGGMGAIELVARYERQDSSRAPLGGTGWAATAGVNWYLTNYFRLMLDGIHWETNNLTGSSIGKDSGNTVAARAEVAF